MRGEPVTEADLQAFVDGRLSPERERQIANWLETRPEDASRVADYRAQSQALRAALASTVEEPLPASLDLRLLGEVAGPRRQRAVWVPAAMAAAILLAVGAAGGWFLRGLGATPVAGTALLAEEAAASYAVYASDSMRPVELGAERRRDIDNWFSNRMSRPITSPDLDAMGLTLIGGRLIATENGPAGLYLYSGARGERIALYVRPMKVEKQDKMIGREKDGVRGWTWADDGLGFGIFGVERTDRLREVANATRRYYITA